MPSGYTEDHQVEQPAIDLFGELGWDTLIVYQEELGTSESDGTLGRETRDEVVLKAILLQKLKEFPVLSEDDDIIVITDEAHRTAA